MWQRMQARRLKRLIDSGGYKPEPALVAQAMLRRRGVRALLSAPSPPLSEADRSRSAPEAGRQAA
jgi:serine/threonine-protein kinase RIO1